MSSSNVAVVRGMFEASWRGDTEGFLAALDDDVEWRFAENFVYGSVSPLIGREAVRNGSLARLRTDWEGFSADLVELIDAGDRVIALGRYVGTYKPTRRELRAQFAHVYTLRQGKVAVWRQFVDTQAFADVMATEGSRSADEEAAPRAIRQIDVHGRPTSVAPFHREPGRGPALRVLALTHVYKATESETGGLFSLWETTMPPGSGAPPHTHSREDECFYVLAGEILVEVEGQSQPLRLGPGGFFFGARGRRHALRNAGAVPARMLTLSVPGAGLERMFTEIGASISSPPNVQELASIAARYGVRIQADRPREA